MGAMETMESLLSKCSLATRGEVKVGKWIWEVYNQLADQLGLGTKPCDYCLKPSWDFCQYCMSFTGGFYSSNRGAQMTWISKSLSSFETNGSVLFEPQLHSKNHAIQHLQLRYCGMLNYCPTLLSRWKLVTLWGSYMDWFYNFLWQGSMEAGWYVVQYLQLWVVEYSIIAQPWSAGGNYQ